MGGIFGVVSKSSCVMDLFFGTDYHSHLGTRRGGMAVYGPNGFQRSIHNIENSPFRTKFERDVEELEGNVGIGSISDTDPQPLLIQSHLGSYAIATVGKINNEEELVRKAYDNGHIHFLEMSGGRINSSELVASIINQRESLVEGLLYAQEIIDGSMSILLLTPEGIYASRDRLGRTSLSIGKKDDGYCVSFESFAYINLGYTDYSELGPGEIVLITPEAIQCLSKPRREMKICSFLWVYYGYPTSTYEGVNVEQMRYNCGRLLAQRDQNDSVRPDSVAGVPDSGIAHAIGYANESGIPFSRPFIKYTPTWPRSFMPQNQRQLNMIPACPPLLFGCKYLNFSRSNSELDLITRRIIREREGDNVSPELLADYADPDSENYAAMVEEIRKRLNFTTLRFHRLDDLVESIGLSPCKLCTYCWSGKE